MRPGWVDKMPRRMWAMATKRAPQASGGVASRRRSWCRLELRSTRSSSRRARVWGAVCGKDGGLAASSSVQCTVPPRTITSRWANSQSALWLSPCGLLFNNSPATCQWPCTVRRTSSSGLSSTSCSRLRLSTERTLMATNTRGRRKAVRPCVSSSSISRNSKEGAQPVDSAVN